jgi:large conductance mechanosensitive channel
MSFLSEFKAFAMKGNVVDMATGIVIGAAFGRIVSTLVDGVIMPPIGLLIGGIDFSRIRTVLKPAGPDGTGEVAIMWGGFINTVISFIIIAFAIFLVIKAMNRMMHREPVPPEAPPPPPPEVKLLTEIRDLLKQGR